MELIIHFSSPTEFSVRYDDDETERLTFNNPISDEHYQDIRWYLETYSTAYIAEPDTNQAGRIEAQIPKWGEALFNAVFLQNRAAQRMLDRLQDEEDDKRYVTISAVYPDVLSLPWELLKDPDGAFLFNENPRIAVRRSLKTRGGRKAHKVKTKETLRLLFVISRPKESGFIDPRLDAQAVLKALEGVEQIEVEFLRQATFDALIHRLENEDLPPVDIVHFDGHGVFDSSGQLAAKGVRWEGFKKEDSKTKQMGYLLFEDAKGEKALVSADMLGEMLHQQQVSLMVLSACQSAMVAGEDALNSVAARLVHAGIPSVLAMTYTVLIKTTELLFHAFYAELAKGQHTGEALENARRYLFRHMARGQRRFGVREFELQLRDWFIPALYQNGRDHTLLKKVDIAPVEEPVWHNLSELQLETHFFGRSKELWDLERWLIDGAKRITMAGFGGQGKTALAIEFGRWLKQKGWFDWLVFVDYKAFQGVDAVSYVVSSVGVVLEESLLDADAAGQALAKTSTLLMLDNVESLETVVLMELLTVVAKWPAIVLLTTRQLTGFEHEQYPVAGSLVHRHVVLEGLREADAVDYLQFLLSLPPEPNRGVLMLDEGARKYQDYARLLRLVKFHPLSIQTIAHLLKTRVLGSVEERLGQLMAELPDNPVLASLKLSIERLDAEAQQYLPLLGVFQGGAMENTLLNITEIPKEIWAKLRPLLETTGLVQVETLPNIVAPYLQFHPALSTALQSNDDILRQRHQCFYYEFSCDLYNKENKTTFKTRIIAKQELPNLLFAVKGALANAADYAGEFVKNVNLFLNFGGLQRDLAKLNEQVSKLAGELGSQNWFFSKWSTGYQLFDAGHYFQAANIFTEILTDFGATTSYNHSATLGMLARCFRFQGQSEKAIIYYRQSLVTAQQLEKNERTQSQIGGLYSDLADMLTDIGHYTKAQKAYEYSLAITQQLKDFRGEAVNQGQLGYLASVQNKLMEAKQRYQRAILQFQQLNEPSHEAIYLYQLGGVYKKTQQWKAAEHVYRQAANIDENLGNLTGAAKTWNQLASIMEMAGKLEEAEAWYQKAIESGQKIKDWLVTTVALSNLANLLQNQSDRLSEAQQLAKQALKISKTLDPAMVTIWHTYSILEQIADKQGDTQTAKNYRRLAREAKANFMGTRYELKQMHRKLILVVAKGDNVEVALEPYRDSDWENLKMAIQQILAGERDMEKLCEPLTFYDAPIITAILEGIERPESLKWFEQNDID